MKTIELSDAEFLFLGSLMGYCFCGNHPLIMPVYKKLLKQHDAESFNPPVTDLELSRPDCLYIKAPEIGKVISYNIPAGPSDALCRNEILAVIKKYNGEHIDG